MRILLFFDVPSITAEDKREYRKFRKSLIGFGYIMMQESVYAKLTTNYSSCALEIEKVKKIKPKKGLVQCLVITENQFEGIINICGKGEHSQIDSLSRLIVL